MPKANRDEAGPTQRLKNAISPHTSNEQVAVVGRGIEADDRKLVPTDFVLTLGQGKS
jgi:hypothetical protein